MDERQGRYFDTGSRRPRRLGRGTMVVSYASNPRIRSSVGWHILGVLLVVAWLICVFGMMDADDLNGKIERLPVRSDLADWLEQDQQWMSIYRQEEKLGYLHTRVLPESNGIKLEQKIHLIVRLAGVRQEFTGFVKVRLSNSSLLESFRVLLDSDYLQALVQGDVDGEILEVEIKIGEELHRRRWSLQEPPVVSLLLPKMLARHNLQVSQRYRVRMFDPLTLSNQSVLISVLSLQAIATQQGLVPAFHVQRTVAGYSVESWIGERGGLLREEYPALGLVLRKEEKERATTPPKGMELGKNRQDAIIMLRALLKGESGGKSKVRF